MGRKRLEGVVGKPVGVRVPPSAPSQYLKGFRLSAEVPFFVKTGRVADLWLSAFSWAVIPPCGLDS